MRNLVVIENKEYSDTVALTGSKLHVLAIDYAYHEIHSGSHYYVKGYEDLAINEVLDFTWQMPNTTKWIHWACKINTES